MKCRAFIIILLFSSLTIVLAQENIEIEKKEFKKDKKGLKEAWAAIIQGNEFYENGGVDYSKAIKEYEKALTYNKIHPGLNYKTGICYYKLNDFKNANKYLKTASEFGDELTKDLNLYLGLSYKSLYKYEDALSEFKIYQSKITKKESKELNPMIEKLIFECQNAVELLKNPVNVYVENLAEPLNSEYADYYPVLTKDKSIMYFTSRRPGKTKKGSKPNPFDNWYFEDVYFANSVGKEWKNVENYIKPVNTEYNDVLLAISSDGNTLYIYRGKDDDGGIYECTNKEGKWSKVKETRLPINSKYRESSLFITSDGNTVYFISDRKKETLGGKDIFVVTRRDEKKWNKPENLGPVVNTEYDEEGLFYEEGSKTLYFSSKGHNSMGGYDVFKTTFEINSWSEPKNVGFPINTPGDDLFFSISEDGRTAYYSSSGQEETVGDMDIYRVYFFGSEKELKTLVIPGELSYYLNAVKNDFIKMEVVGETKKVTILKGVVKNAETLVPIKAHIEIVDQYTNTLLYESYSDSISGAYYVTLTAGNSYGISVSAEKYLFQSDYFDIPDSASFQEIEKEVLLAPIKVGNKLILKNIVFEFGKTTLSKESYVELGFAIKVLKENPTMQIEVSGHTDNIGSANSNIKLSTARAKSVVEYFIEKGVNPEQLVSKGYGYSEPIASNDTEEGRAQNRRVEFKILGFISE